MDRQQDELAERRRMGAHRGPWREMCQEPGCKKSVEVRLDTLGYMPTVEEGWLVTPGADRQLVVKCPEHWAGEPRG